MIKRWDRRSLATKAWWAMGSLWVVVVVWAFLNGPRRYAEAAEVTARQVELEDRDACKRLNAPFGGDGYSVCASVLDGVRRQQLERTERDANGIL